MRYSFIIAFIFISTITVAQFPGTDSLRNYNNKYITNNPATAFTNLRLNTLLRGIIDWVDTARAGTGGGGVIGVDTLYALNDSTVRYRKNGVFRNVIIKGVYDYRRKVDTMYKVNDTTIGFNINGQARTLIFPNGISQNIANASLIANGDYIQDWANHWFFLNNLKSWEINQNQADPNHVNNLKVFRFYADSTADATVLQLAWGLKNINNDITDSLHFEINSTKDSTYLKHWINGGSKYVELDIDPHAGYPQAKILASDGTKTGTYNFGASTATLQPNDSVRLLAIPATTAPKVLGLRASAGNTWTVVAIDPPSTGITSLNSLTGSMQTFATGSSGSDFNISSASATHTFNIPTASASNRGLLSTADWSTFNSKQPAGNYITALTGDVTASGPGSAAATITTNAVTDAKFRQSAGLSVIGRSANTTGNVADITAGSDNQVLRRSGTTLGFGEVNLASSNAVTGLLPIANGGTGTSSPSLVAGTNITITGSWPNQTINSTGGSSNFKDSDVVNALSQYPLLHNNSRFNQGDSIYFFGDSYTYGSGATSGYRWTTLVAYRLGAVEVNYGIPGSTLMKRSPVDWNGGTNMIDRLSTVPTKTFNRRLLVFAFGLNDLGQTAAAYTVANFKTDYDSVMHYCANKGWAPYEILIIPPYWIGQAGYNAYATASGNAAPTYQRHLDFVQATQETATKWGTLYFNIYNDQLRNDTTLITGDNVHANDAGHAFIEWDVSRYIGAIENIQQGTRKSLSTTTPLQINQGGSYSSVSEDIDKMKMVFYDDGSTNTRYGIGVSAQNFYLHAGGSGAKFTFKINGASTPVATINDTKLLLGVNTSGTSTATPQSFDAGGTYANTAGDDNKLKYYVYNDGSARAGLGLSFGHLEYHVFSGGVHDFFIAGTKKATVQDTALYMPNLKIIAKADSSATATGGFVYRDAATGTFKITGSSGGGITSINSQSGPAITIQGGVGISTSTTTNTVTVEVNTASNALPHTLNKQYSPVGNTGTSESDLYTYTIPGNTMNTDGQSVHFEMAGLFNDATATVALQLYFGGVSFANTGALTIGSTGKWSANGYIIRTSSSDATAWVTINSQTTTDKSYTFLADLSGVDFTAGNIFKLTGQAGGGGGGSNDITAKTWVVRYQPL
jgi:hypothetical protein